MAWLLMCKNNEVVLLAVALTGDIDHPCVNARTEHEIARLAHPVFTLIIWSEQQS